MKTCVGCKYADWKKTAAGRMHPSGEGRCTYEWKMPPLPGSMDWIFGQPAPVSLSISRRRALPDHCPYYVRGEWRLPAPEGAETSREGHNTEAS